MTGVKLGGETRLNTVSSTTDFTRIGGWALGEGELDGCQELWDTGLEKKLFNSEFDDPTKFHFHRGCDAVIGGGFSPGSSGPDQGVDSFVQYLPSGVQPLCYNRIANCWLRMKSFVNNPENDHQDDANNFADLNPIGLWRGLRVRLFNETGQMTGYGFTTCPTWQLVDLILRRKIMPEFSIDRNTGIDDLTDGENNQWRGNPVALSLRSGAISAPGSSRHSIRPATGAPPSLRPHRGR